MLFFNNFPISLKSSAMVYGLGVVILLKSINNGHWPQNLLERLKFVENKVYLLYVQACIPNLHKKTV